MLYDNIPGYFTWEPLYRLFVQKAPRHRKSIIVEVGTYRGRSAIYLAELIYRSGKDIKLVCVDTWNYFAGVNYTSNLDYLKFILSAGPLRNIIHPMRMESVVAANFFENGELQGAFIDAAHDYPSVKADITAWLPKIRKSGIFAGHDFTDEFPGVKQAVTEALGTDFRVWKDCWVKTI